MRGQDLETARVPSVLPADQNRSRFNEIASERGTGERMRTWQVFLWDPERDPRYPLVAIEIEIQAFNAGNALRRAMKWAKKRKLWNPDHDGIWVSCA